MHTSDPCGLLTAIPAVGSSGLLAGFTAAEQLAILYRTGNNPTPESVRAIPERDWRKMRNIGDRFIVKLTQRGWLGEAENRVRREAMSEKERHKRNNAARLKKLKGMIGRANQQIKYWEREAARLAS
jgi:hypothetical protein